MLDTDVVVAGMRSPTGASAALLRLARRKKFTLLLSPALAIEYEAICTLPEHYGAAGLTHYEAQQLVDVIIAVSEEVERHYSWRPFLRDPGDEIVLETATNGRAQAIITFNQRDFAGVTDNFGIPVLLPGIALRRIN